MAARMMKPLSFHTVASGAPVLIASIAWRKSHGMTLVIAADANTIRRPSANWSEYGL
jgi:hypothetical protein